MVVPPLNEDITDENGVGKVNGYNVVVTDEKKHRLPMRSLQFQRTADYLLNFPRQTRLTLKTESALL
ncbi:MAG: hypothetical protein L6V93_02295 [Clostridiales bacterium]|nr:MAG: hypothetical protein L6V93_02295 [Clostridiales bacterium]